LGILILATSSCKKDELIFPNFNKNLLTRTDWSTEEKFFFKFDNQLDLLGNKTQILPRTDNIPDILLSVYNNLVENNEQDSFVYSVARRIGYPVWLQSTFEISEDSTGHFVYIPFVRPDSTHISGYLLGYKDYSSLNSELILQINLRSDLDSTKNRLKPININTCHDLMRTLSFDKYIFESVTTQEFAELFCEACFEDDPLNPIINSGICDTTSITICYQIDGSSFDDVEFQEYGWQVTTNPQGTFGGGTSSNGSNTIIFGGLYDNVSFGNGSNPGSGPGGEIDWGALFDDVKEWISGAANWIGEAIGNGGAGINNFFSWIGALFGPNVLCPNNFFTGEPEIESRTDEYICSPYLIISCYNGSWWQVVNSLPCDGCDIDLELEKAKEAFCMRQGSVFADSILGLAQNHPEYKRAQIAAIQCCKLNESDPDCAKNAMLKSVVGLSDEEIECISEVKDELLDLVLEGAVRDVCDPTATTSSLLRKAVQGACSSQDPINNIGDVYSGFGEDDKIYIATGLKTACPMYNCIVDEVMTGSLGSSFVCDLMEEFDGDDEQVLIFQPYNFTAGGYNPSGVAFTTVIEGNIYIRINTNNCTSTNAFNAFETIQHELIHADILRRLFEEYNWSGSDQSLLTAFNELVIAVNGSNPTFGQHKLMLDLYVDKMAESMLEFNNNIGISNDFLGLIYNGFPQQILYYHGLDLGDVAILYTDYQNFISQSGNINSKLSNCP
jgi:hypothetical protein